MHTHVKSHSEFFSFLWICHILYTLHILQFFLCCVIVLKSERKLFHSSQNVKKCKFISFYLKQNFKSSVCVLALVEGVSKCVC